MSSHPPASPRPIVEVLASNLKAHMDAQGLTQVLLAKRTGGYVSQKSISNVCRGDSANLDTVEALAKALKVELYRLMVEPDSDAAKLHDGWARADAGGRELIGLMIEREATRGG